MGGGRGEGQEEEENRPRGCTGSAAKLQRIEKCGLKRQVWEEMVRGASLFRHGSNACGVNLVIGSVREARSGSVRARRVGKE
jgi:hypothetical protein